MDLIAIDITFFDMVPSPTCLFIIWFRFNDGSINGDAISAEEMLVEELLNELIE
jgi:hypothetical protein